jgi:hypothetical protein
MHFVVMVLALPLWIAQYTSAPRSLVAITLMINTVCVALLQVRLTRGIDLVGPRRVRWRDRGSGSPGDSR